MTKTNLKMTETPKRKYIHHRFCSEPMLKLPRELPTEYIDIIMIQVMTKVGIDPAVVYAFEKTLLWVTEANERSYTRKQLEEWDAAVNEFRSNK